MNKSIKCRLILISVLLPLFFSCYNKESELQGSWESVRIDHSSSFFRGILPSTDRGEIYLMFEQGGKFRWINKKEKLELTGTYKINGDKLIFRTDKETIRVSYSYNEKILHLLTEDGFTFYFNRIP